VPARRLGSDMELVATCIGLSAVLWIVASLALVAVSACWNLVGHLSGVAGSVDLWQAWVAPALSSRSTQVADLLPGIVLSLLGGLFGLAVALLMRSGRGPNRVFRLGGLRWDVNPTVWTWFLQDRGPGDLYRIRLKTGTVLVGQVSEYSTDPTTSNQELVLRVYSRGPDQERRIVPVYDAETMLLARSDVETIERLSTQVTASGQVVDRRAEGTSGTGDPPGIRPSASPPQSCAPPVQASLASGQIHEEDRTGCHPRVLTDER
jgi:Family of unknown function (DUF6338)